MSQPKYSCDIAIIGAGIVGVTLGLAVLESNPNFKVTLFEKENDVGLHASGRNSGVIHAGFYYSSESLKAKFCHQGNIELRKFCSENKLQIRESGKIVVARDEKDVQILEDLSNRAQKNGVDVELLDISKLVTKLVNMAVFACTSTCLRAPGVRFTFIAIFKLNTLCFYYHI